MRSFTAYAKYAHYALRFGNVRKMNNMLLNRYEFKKSKTILRSRPYKVTVDPGNFCNLRCPGCHTGIRHPEMIKPSFLTLNDYREILAQVKDHALSISLYNWGEPFLNKEIFDIISHTTDNRLGSTIHSNFNIFSEEKAEYAVRSGLTHIYLSIDGQSQETYTKYRVKGDIDRVMENVSIMLETRKRMGSKYPRITWKYLEFDHNLHEVKEAANQARKIGVDSFEVFSGYPKLMDIYEEAELYRTDNSMLQSLKGNCRSLWDSIYIHSDGSVFPCSLSFRPTESFGNLLADGLDEVWNNQKYSASRRMFTHPFSNDNVPLPCSSCKFFVRNSCTALRSLSEMRPYQHADPGKQN